MTMVSKSSRLRFFRKLPFAGTNGSGQSRSQSARICPPLGLGERDEGYARRCRRIPREMNRMNGAESLVHTLLQSDVDTCFANPGTSEMHFVAALDRVPG